ncbi:hypothetical protein D6855_01990 [Butyrivibrio sp. CB08]|uniref:hypothetical protein n=1 Tax=Butyrivibrio sp. CB08 TaxID=2364879 RepID=UPI000EA8DF49|nr:hypothetical protein [Butyrivibrio sp. CB08]RKM62214.1 hypothetical protein D6855_01990 [Butyrivibrio sp. CB08]
MKKRESVVLQNKTASVELEETLASLGALSAVMRIRKCYPISDSFNSFDHHQVEDVNLRLA